MGRLVVLALDRFLRRNGMFLYRRVINEVNALSCNFNGLLSNSNFDLDLTSTNNDLAFDSRSYLLLNDLDLISGHHLFAFKRRALLLLLAF